VSAGTIAFMINLQPKTKKYLRLAGKILLLLIVAGSLAWFYIINPYLIRQEKQRFESAATELEKLSQQIQTTIDIPVETSKEQSCGRANLKSEEGPLICNTASALEYKISGEEANQILSKSSVFSNYPLREGPLAKSTQFLDTAGSSLQVIYQDIGMLYGFSCVTSYEYYPPGVIGNEENTLKVILNCGGPARAEHYPVED
jgi:hypothetical protein